MRRTLTDERIKGRKLYVEDGITSFSEIATHLNIQRQTVARWASEDNWAAQRTSQMTSVDNITTRMLVALEKYVVLIEQKQANNDPVSPMLLKQLSDMVRSIKALKDDFDERGATITMWKRLIAYLTLLPQERPLLKDLQRIAPGFFSYIER